MPDARQDLIDGTKGLGELLESLSDSDPSGRPTENAAAAFQSWVADAEAFAPKPEYFQDVATNFNPLGHTNKDLHDLFEILIQHVAMQYEGDDEEIEPRTPGTFINLPLLIPNP